MGNLEIKKVMCPDLESNQDLQHGESVSRNALVFRLSHRGVPPGCSGFALMRLPFTLPGQWL